MELIIDHSVCTNRKVWHCWKFVKHWQTVSLLQVVENIDLQTLELIILCLTLFWIQTIICQYVFNSHMLKNSLLEVVESIVLQTLELIIDCFTLFVLSAWGKLSATSLTLLKGKVKHNSAANYCSRCLYYLLVLTRC